jgi:glycosyltransferase involved in cell wall biosynthesis
MKVLQVTTNYPCNENPIFGIFMKEQAESVEKFGVKNTIFFSNGLKAKNATFIHLKSAAKLFFHLLTHRYDVIHCHNVLGGLILLLSGGFLWNKFILSIQNDPSFTGEGNSSTWLIKYVIPLCKKVIVKMPFESNNPKYVYLPNGVNLDLFKPVDVSEAKKALGLDPSKRYILFVDSNTTKGRTQKRKDRFNETMSLLRSKYGHNDIEELLLINVTRDKVPTYMNACELYLLTSDEEGSPNAVKECMACNTPVVSTPVGNVPDLFDGVNDCKMSATFNAAELAELADMVLNSNCEAHTREMIMRKGLDMNSIAERLYKLYCEINCA